MESEFRKDIVSGDWVLIASDRGKRPHALRHREENYQKPEDCPFEDPQASGNGPSLLTFPEGSGDAWRIQTIKNKYPAVAPGLCSPIGEREGYQVTQGVGYHELVVFRDHDRFFPDFTDAEMADVIRVYRDRYRQIAAEDECARYIMIFHNFGHEGGASIYHPHSQIVSLPILPPDVARSLRGSVEYHHRHKREAHEVMIAHELADGKRIIYENENFVAFCPFVSKQPCEVRIYPRTASAYFERIHDADLQSLGVALRAVVGKFKKALGDPAYNFFIHTAPLKVEDEDVLFGNCYRWHIELIPRIRFEAGFEAGTGIRINMMDPDLAAEMLNSQNV